MTNVILLSLVGLVGIIIIPKLENKANTDLRQRLVLKTDEPSNRDNTAYQDAPLFQS